MKLVESAKQWNWISKLLNHSNSPIISNPKSFWVSHGSAPGQQHLRLCGANSPIAAAFSRGAAAAAAWSAWSCGWSCGGTVELVRSSNWVWRRPFRSWMSTLESTHSSITRCCASFLLYFRRYIFCISSEFPRAANFKAQSYRTAEILGAGRSQTSDTFHSFGHVVAEGVTEPMLRCCGDPGTTWNHLEPPGTTWNHLEPPGTTWNLLGTTWEPPKNREPPGNHPAGSHLGNHLGNHLGTTWEPGNHLGTTWEPPGNHLGTSWEPPKNREPPGNHPAGSHLGNHLGTTWEPPGNHLGTTCEPLGNHLGTRWEPPRPPGNLAHLLDQLGRTTTSRWWRVKKGRQSCLAVLGRLSRQICGDQNLSKFEWWLEYLVEYLYSSSTSFCSFDFWWLLFLTLRCASFVWL